MDWIRALLNEHWSDTRIASRGVLHAADELPAFVACAGGQRCGLATYHLAGEQCELVSLNSLRERNGVGTALVHAVRDVARAHGCTRFWLITTNDNLHALRFYQKLGFELVALHRNALEASRRLKPQIPAIGLDGIPLRDELELELKL